MPLIHAPLGEDYEDKPVPEGEYDLRITRVEQAESEKADIDLLIRCTIAVEDANYPHARPVRHTLAIPAPNHQYASLMWRNLKRFLAVFGVEFTTEGFNDEDLLDATGRCGLAQTEPNDAGDVFNELVLPRLREEGKTPPADAGRAARRGRR